MYFPLPDFSLLIVAPVYRPNIGEWRAWIDAIREQSVSASVLVIDSGSPEGVLKIAQEAGFSIHEIAAADFNHGGTRQFAVENNPEYEIIIFLTQDAILVSPDSLVNLLAVFASDDVGAVYGRQLPRPAAEPIEAHARLFNYPASSHVCDFADAASMGIKAAFMSNSFAAYRRSALMEVGGFPSNVILGEDTIVAAKMLMAGWKVAYQADAQVYHSHDYTYLQEFRRYFDIGVMHTRESWMLKAFGKPEGEGARFVRSELAYLLKKAPWLIPSAILRTGLKYLGYRLGRMESRLPLSLKRYLSMHKGYWK
ncbi:MAG: rhamnosyltransferase [Halothiobacillus sp. 15-55-196]|jgi:rhamnosyltransferase|uniref:glycosyltransferase n=1 Tax=Halothiobacillus sp. 15-55-196 TaxID=1970382 RepID=UPI000BC9A75F|nr:glycosyltransferase family 2 protein [Halothiobacillus sp. 15-55-196]OZB37026.1 MAG: rhamnosyltransferase [Halothiobacillus sp. 15-55-196]